jgi:hypothetical protein
MFLSLWWIHGSALFFDGRSMLRTGQCLLKWDKKSHVRVSSFKRLALSKTANLLLPFWRMDVKKWV